MQFITDCEGPISKNDNALELATNFLPEGEKFFTQLSRYDDFLALTGREGYKAGDTLRLILPFLKAYGTTDKKIVEYFSQRNLPIIVLRNFNTATKTIDDMIANWLKEFGANEEAT